MASLKEFGLNKTCSQFLFNLLMVAVPVALSYTASVDMLLLFVGAAISPLNES